MNPKALLDSIPADKRIEDLMQKLQERHGRVDVRHEASGMHLYMACPKCVETYGWLHERKRRHLAVNVDKLFGLNAHNLRFLEKRPNSKKKGYAQCMKEHGPFTIEQLLNYPTLEARNIQDYAPVMFVEGKSKRYLVPDDKGNMIPDGPGETIPVTQLPHTHPAIQYLNYRGYDPVLLHQQFAAAWCTKEAPEGEAYNRWYRRHAGDWKSTPQGRIIFYSYVSGVRVCWQGRYLDVEDNGIRYVWHPYRERWEPRPDWQKGEDPIKYNTASSAYRNSQLCGFDAAVQSIPALRDEVSTCVLTEGPLDAARFPYRGMAVLGKSVSDAQALLISLYFRRVILAFDADSAGAGACRKAAETLRRFGVQTIRFFTEEEEKSDGKIDAGVMGYEACAERLQQRLMEFKD